MFSNKLAVHSCAIALLVAVTAIAYSNSFQGEFTLDDFVNIHNSQGIRLFQPSLEGIIQAATDGPSGNRWFPNISFALNYYFNGEETWGYHLVNIFIHLTGAITLYFLCLTTLNLPLLKNTYSNKTEIAFFATLLWAVHPLQTNGVTYIVQRMTGMSALFYLLALLCYIKARFSHGLYMKQITLFSGGLLFWFMAIKSKENAYMLPIIILAYEIFFLEQVATVKNYKKLILWLNLSVTLILGCAVLFLGKDIFSHIVSMYEYRDFTMSERLLTESRVLFLYISLIFLPLPGRLNLNHDISISQGLLSPPQTFFSLVGIFLIVALVIYSFKRNRLFSFGVLWFLVNLLMESTFIPLELVYEHRLYLPTTLLFLGITAPAINWFEKYPRQTRVALLCIICVLSFWTWERNKVWASNLTIWSDVITKSPGNERAYNNLGTVYHDQKQYRQAEQLFLQAIRLAPESRQAYVSLGSLYISQGKNPEALQLLKVALTKEAFRNPARIYHYMGIIYRKTGRYQEAINAADMALKLNPKDVEPMITQGIAYGKLRQFSKADAIFAKAEQLGIHDTNLYNNWGTAVYGLGKIDRSIEYFQKSIAINPSHPESHYNLGLAYGAKGLVNEARKEMNLSMQLRQKELSAQPPR